MITTACMCIDPETDVTQPPMTVEQLVNMRALVQSSPYQDRKGVLQYADLLLDEIERLRLEVDLSRDAARDLRRENRRLSSECDQLRRDRTLALARSA